MPRWGWLAFVLLLAGCAAGTPVGLRVAGSSLRHRHVVPAASPDTRPRATSGALAPTGMGGSSPAALVARTAMGALVLADPFEVLLEQAGLNDLSEWPPREASLTPEDAALLYDALLERPVTLEGFGPRRVAFHLLSEVMEGDEELSRDVLRERLARFRFLAVLRPDGYLAWALSGKTQQRVGPVQWSHGAFRAGRFEVGPFYQGLPGMAFFPVDEQFQRAGNEPLAEVYDDADVISRVLDGAGEASFELAMATGQFLTTPLDSLASLKHLPEGLAALLASSPEYFERFRLMTRGEQIQALSKLTTSLLLTRGAASGTTRTLANAGRALEATAPAMALSAEGTLALERVAIPAGRLVTTLSGGPGAALVLHRVNEAGKGSNPGPSKGPGEWAPSRESMSRRAARYQQQITGHPVDESYWVGGTTTKAGGVKFDGFKDGVLLEAKGPGYANKFLDNLAPQRWFKKSGAEQLIAQAKSQLKVANGVPIRWHVAEEKAAGAIQKLLEMEGIVGIEVVYTPALP